MTESSAVPPSSSPSASSGSSSAASSDARVALGLPTGRVRPMVHWGQPIMHRTLTPVTAFDAELAQIVADMFVTMDAADGVGLAANQIGVDLALFVFDVRMPDETGALSEQASTVGGSVGVVCNPTLTEAQSGDEWITDSEGCLSLPGAFVPCKRRLVAGVSGVDHTGAPVRYEGSGLMARCLQHEADHLRGVVFADHVPGRLRRKLNNQAARFAPEFPADWPVSPRVELVD